MFQTAYRQITPQERSFVDWLVDELVQAAKRLGQRIAQALNKPLPHELLLRDVHGWLQRPLVRAAVTERIQHFAELEEISPASWIREVHAIAHFNISDILTYDEAGDPVIDLDAASREQMAAIKSVEIEKSDGLSRSTRTKIKITTHDKVAALKMEAAYLGLDDGDNPHRRADKAAAQQALPAHATAEQAGDAYAAMIGDD